MTPGFSFPTLLSHEVALLDFWARALSRWTRVSDKIDTAQEAVGKELSILPQGWQQGKGSLLHSTVPESSKERENSDHAGFANCLLPLKSNLVTMLSVRSSPAKNV